MPLSGIMQITALRLTGFKSFVEPTELKIQPGLTGIVGPNGCGKSNLLEAIRWVMGESSPKSMRGGGMDDVIFAGTGTRPARDFAEVTLIGQVPDAVLPGIGDPDMPNDLEVIRRIERGSGSAYRVNGRDVRAKDVALIFADAATGAHSPALVSQGKIAAVISAKPAERRQMLEEAAGISGLYVRRKDAEQKLRATETNLSRLGDILADMDSRIGSLRRQARAAERYTKLSEQIRITEGRMIFARWRDAAAASDAAKAELAERESAVTDAQTKVEVAAERQRSAAETLANLRQDIDRARIAANDVAQALALKRSELATLERRQQDLVHSQAQIAADQAREDDLAQEAARSVQARETELTDAKAQLQAEEAAVAPLAIRIGELSVILRDAEIALAKARSALASDMADRKVADASMAAAQIQAERAKQDQARIAEALSAVQAKAPNDAAFAEAEAERDTADQAVQTAEADLEQAISEESNTSAAAQAATAQASEIRAQLAALTSEESALALSLQRSDDSVRLSDHISVAPGYEAAIAAALNDDMEAGFGNSVSEGWRGAKTQANDPALPTGAVPLSNYVTAPQELARRLAQIGVVDQDDGQLLATGQMLIQRDGQMRRWDGLVRISAGSAAAARLVRQNRLMELDALVITAQKQCATHDLSAETAAEQLRAARDRLAEVRKARSVADSLLRDALRHIDRVEAEKNAATAQIAMLNERQAAADVNAAESAAALAAATKYLADLPDVSARQAEVDQLHEETETLRAALSDTRSQQEQHRARAATLREQQAECTADIRGWKARSGEAVQRISAMAERAKTIAKDMAALAEQPPKLTAAVAQLEQERDTAQRGIDALAVQEREGTVNASAADALLNAARDAHAEAREARAGATARAEAAELRRIEMGRVSGERFSCPPPLLPETLQFEAETVGDASQEGAAHERQMAERERIGPVNLVAAQELSEVEAIHATSTAEAEELLQAVNRLRGSIGNLNREGRTRLTAAFEAVNAHFQTLFATLFDGGNAHLALVDSDDPLEAGLEIFAQPPGKKLATLTLLSGGEQALTAVALIFGLFLTNPAPICVLDEVDAPLDDANIERFCDLLNRMIADTKTRYLIVTHNAVTMARMHRLFGVTMVEKGVSRLVSVDLGGAEELLAAE